MKINKRITFGRRRSDWLVPLAFIAVGIGASFWASYNRTKKYDLQRQNEVLQSQVENLNRLANRNDALEARVEELESRVAKYKAEEAKRRRSIKAVGVKRAASKTGITKRP